MCEEKWLRFLVFPLQALSRLEDSRAEISAQYPFLSTIYPEESSNQLPETIIAENFDKLTNGGDESSEALDCSTPESPDYPRPVPSVNENDASPSLENDSSKTSVCGSSSDSPTLSAVLGMDSVARLSSLRRRIRLAENMTTLSRNDCAWLFALCAAIDTLLDADTCAALRCLLRKCASLRAGKLELDDEVVMLNILATITGKYFGQSELWRFRFRLVKCVIVIFIRQIPGERSRWNFPCEKHTVLDLHKNSARLIGPLGQNIFGFLPHHLHVLHLRWNFVFQFYGWILSIWAELARLDSVN